MRRLLKIIDNLARLESPIVCFSIGWRFCFAIFGDFYPFIGSLMTFGSCNRVELIELSPRSRLYRDQPCEGIYHA